MITQNSRDPEPLAYQVRPQGDECFDSWLGRLARALEVKPVELFDYLRIDTALTHIDLARGRRGVPASLRKAFDHMVGRLAWAVAIDVQHIRAMFLKGSPNQMLPPFLRRFVCPVCALERHRSGQPIIVRREWTLRLAWHCHDHRVLLVDLGLAERIQAPLWGWLERAGDAMAAFDAAQDYDDELIARNRQSLKHLLGPSPGSLSRANAEYVAKFERNRWHLASSRTLLLASGHGREPLMVARYRQFEQQLDAMRRYDELWQVTVPVTLTRLENTICRIHIDLVGRGPGRLAALQGRLRARSVVLGNAQAKLDRSYARFRTAWERQVRQRAFVEGRKVLAADCEAMLGRISLACWENRSPGESLRYLQAARDYWRAAQARQRNTWPPKPIAHPEDWGLRMPPIRHLEQMIDERAQALRARA